MVANGENSAGGSGITPETAEELFGAGVDVITSGDHLWDQKEVNVLLQRESRFLRPLNYPVGCAGQGSVVVSDRTGQLVAVVNLQGRTFMPALENPFVLAVAEVERLRTKTPIIFVDIHAEATSEKLAMARLLDGRASAVIGTHTHVQTADERILPGGTAFLCDAGFTGPQDGILGRESQPVIDRFLTNEPRRFEVAKHDVVLHGAVVEIQSDGRARGIRRVALPLPEMQEG